MREKVKQELDSVIQGEFLPDDCLTVAEEISHLNDDNFLDYVVKQFKTAAKNLKIVGADYLEKNIFSGIWMFSKLYRNFNCFITPHNLQNGSFIG